MNRNVIIIGAGGHGKVIADIVLAAGDNIIGFLDDNIELNSFIDFPILGIVSDYKKYTNNEFIIAIGNADIREKIAVEMDNARFYTAIHPTAVISHINTAIGEGTAVMANAVINPSVSIGKHCIINTAAVVEHDNVIEDFVHVSVGSKLGGTVHIGSKTWIGIGATVKNNIEICSACMIGAGCTVINDLSESGIYVGVPASKLVKTIRDGVYKIKYYQRISSCKRCA